MILTFGKHKGEELSSVPIEYLHWLTDPKLRDGGVFNVPDDIRTEAKCLLTQARYSNDRLAGMEAIQRHYVIERLGDINGLTIHDTLDIALSQVSSEYPIRGGERETPDPEDDRILIWEVLPSGHKKVVWHFSGWHWNSEEFWELQQGTLPGDDDDLYSIAVRKC